MRHFTRRHLGTVNRSHSYIDKMIPKHLSILIWLVIFSVFLVWSLQGPSSTLIWFLEVFPAIAFAIAIISTRKTFPLTPLLYGLLLVHSIILMVGARYTYAEVPLFDTLAEWMGGTRNNYDKVGHFMQGFVPAMITREVFIRKNVVNTKGWRNFLIVATCLAISAFYELIEWWVATIVGENADAFLGTQGYVWDTQSDMMLALSGAILALLFLARWHDRDLKKVV